jgi:ATP-binding cassette subfamily B protein
MIETQLGRFSRLGIWSSSEWRNGVKALKHERIGLRSEAGITIIRRLFLETGRLYWPRYLLAGFFMLLFAGTSTAAAWIMKDVVDRVFIEQRADWLIYLAIVIVIISALRAIGAFGSAVTMSRIGNSIVARIQTRLYDHYLALGMDFYNRTHASELVTRMSYNAAAARNVLNTVVTNLVRDLFTVIGLLLVMIIQNPAMSLITLVAGPIGIYGVRRLLHLARQIAKKQLATQSAVVSHTLETVQAIPIVKAFNLEVTMRSRMAKAIDAARMRNNRIANIQARTGPLMEMLGGLAIAGVVLWAGLSAIYLHQPPGAFVSFIAAILLATQPAKRLANTRVHIESALVGVAQMYEILDIYPSMDANRAGPDLRPDQPLFRDFDLCVPAGKVTALVGPSGAGKSTLVSLIERYYAPESGRIAIDGQDIAQVRLASLRDQIALVSQNVILFRASIRDNIRFGRLDASDATIEQAARNAMAHDFVMATANGYDTILDDGGPSLSGGQRQRIAIARAMLRNAPIILLDEATSSLDSESEHQIQIAFDRLTKNRTTIVIAHRLSTVLSADRICVIVDGKLFEEGRHADLLAKGGHYARLYHLQFERHSAARSPSGDRAPAAERLPG